MPEDLNQNSEQQIFLAEASETTGYHQDYLGYLARTGKLRAYKIGRNWVTTKSAIDELMSKGQLDAENSENISKSSAEKSKVEVHVQEQSQSSEKSGETVSLPQQNIAPIAAEPLSEDLQKQKLGILKADIISEIAKKSAHQKAAEVATQQTEKVLAEKLRQQADEAKVAEDKFYRIRQMAQAIELREQARQRQAEFQKDLRENLSGEIDQRIDSKLDAKLQPIQETLSQLKSGQTNLPTAKHSAVSELAVPGLAAATMETAPLALAHSHVDYAQAAPSIQVATTAKKTFGGLDSSLAATKFNLQKIHDSFRAGLGAARYLTAGLVGVSALAVATVVYVGAVVVPKLQNSGTVKTIVMQGQQGPQGAQGPQGPAGQTAALNGAPVVEKIVYLKGPKGDTGAIGPQGPQGPAGTNGATGPQGPAGSGGGAYLPSNGIIYGGIANQPSVSSSNQVSAEYLQAQNAALGATSVDGTFTQTGSNANFTTSSGIANLGNPTINLLAASPVIDANSGTLYINTASNNPVSFGTGLVTVPNLTVSGNQQINGPLAVTTTSTPQVSVGYDTADRWTASTDSTGKTAFNFTGANSSATFTPQNDSTAAFVFNNAAGNPVLNLDTTHATLSVSGNVNATGNITLASTAGSTFTAGNTTGAASITGTTVTISGNSADITLQTTTNGNINLNPVGVIDANASINLASGKSITAVGGASNVDLSASTGTFKTGSGTITVNSPTINLAAANPVMDAAPGSTLYIDTVNNDPVTFGTGAVTVPNLVITNSQNTNSTQTGTVATLNAANLTTGTGFQENITANAGNGQTTMGQQIAMTDNTTAGGGFTGLNIYTTGSGVGTGPKLLLDLNPGLNKEVVFDNSGALRPVINSTASIGTPSFFFNNGYFNNIVANNLSGTVVTGSTSSTTWVIGSTQTGDTNEALVFNRGSGNPTLSWDSSTGDLRYLSTNYPLNATYTVNNSSIGTTVNLLSGTLTNNTTSGTQRLLALTNTGTGTTADGIYVNNTGTGTTAIEISGTWTNGLVTGNNSINAGTGALTANGNTTLATNAGSSLTLGNTTGTNTINGSTTFGNAVTFNGGVTYNSSITGTTLALTSPSTPQLSVGYDSSNKWTASTTSTGATTFALSGSSPSLSITGGNVGIGAVGQGYSNNWPNIPFGKLVVGPSSAGQEPSASIVADGEWTQPASGFYEDFGVSSLAYSNIPVGVTQSGQNTAYYGESFRNMFGTGDNGTLTYLFGGRLLYGHYNTDAAATPQTTNAYGLFLYPYAQTGHINNLYDLYIGNLNGSSSNVSQHWGVYQSDSSIKNYLAANLGVGISSPTSTLAIQPAATSGTPSATAGSGFQLLGTNTYTDNNTATSGTATGYNLATIAQGTLAATNTSVTTTNAYSLNILGAPKGGTNETLTNSIALNIASAALTNTTNGYGLQVAAPTGATNNYAAAFLGGNVGIGTTTPVANLDVEYTNNTSSTGQAVALNATANSTGDTYNYISTFDQSNSNINNIKGLRLDTGFTGSGINSNVTNLVGLEISGPRQTGGSSGTATNSYQLKLVNGSQIASTGHNFAIYQSDSGMINYLSSSLGIGTTAPTATLAIQPAATSGTPSATAGSGLQLLGTNTFTDNATLASGTATGYALGTIAQPTLAATNTGVTTTNAYALRILGPVTGGTNETITNSSGLDVAQASLSNVTNGYGLRVNAPTGATNNYAAYFNGNVGIGTSTPTVSLSNNGDFITAGPRVDVRAFGAKGDGVNDDTAAIQAAINSVDQNQGHIGGEVYLPKGTYLVSSPLIMGNLVSFVGDGWDTIIKMANNVNINLLQQPSSGSVTYVTIRDLNLFGNDYNNTAGSAISISYNGSTHSDIHVDDVLINHFGGDCVYIATGWQYHFNNNIIEDCGGSIMHFQPVVGSSDGIHDLRRVYIESNGLMMNVRPHNSSKDGLYFQGGNGETLTGINIIGNEIGNNDIQENAIHLQSVSNFVINGNRIGGGSQAASNTYDGVRIDDDGVLASEYGTISGNSFAGGDNLGGQERYGISVLNLSHDITIGDNQFTGILTQNIYIQNTTSNISNGVFQNGLGQVNLSASTSSGSVLGVSQTGSGYAAIFTGGNVGIGTASPTATLAIQPAATSGTPNLTAGNRLQLLGSTFTDNATASSGTATGFANATISQGTLAATNTGVTTTNAYTLNVLGAPTGGTNETLTNSTALNIASAALTNTTNGYGLQVNAPTGATNNYAAVFNGGNVGIGTTSPSQLLSVGSSSQFTVNSSGAFSAGANSSISGGLSVNSYVVAGGNYTMSVGGLRTLSSGNGVEIGRYNGSTNGTFTASTGSQAGIALFNTVNQSGSASFTDLLLNSTETTTGSGGHNLLDLQTGGTSRFLVQSGGNVGIGIPSPGSLLTLQGSQPASSSSNGTAATGVLAITGGQGGNTTGITGQTAGAGANVTITAGQGGTAPSGSTNANGGTITLQGGAPGNGAGTAGSYGNIALQASGGNVGIGTASPTATLAIQPAATSGTPSPTAGNRLQLLGSTFTDNNTAASGTATGFANATVSQGTLAATNTGVTTTNAYTLNILGPVTGGTNETLTNSTALNIASAALTNTTNGYGLQVNAPTGATNNYAAYFNGNVGIGTTGPNNPLSLVGNSATTPKVFEIKNQYNIVNGTPLGAIYFTGGSPSYSDAVTSSAPGAYVKALGEGTWGGYLPTALTFGTTSSSSGTALERMRIANNGNVGIGTTTPAAALDVYSGSSNTLLNIGGPTGTYHYLSFLTGGTVEGQFGIMSASSNDIWLRGNGSSNLLLQNNGGNVGIGITNPAVALDVGGQVQSALGFNISSYNTLLTQNKLQLYGANGFIMSSDSTGNLSFGHEVSSTPNYTGAILNNGNVGIGTTSPGMKVEIGGGTGLPNNSGSTQLGALRVNVAGGNNGLDFGVNNAGDGASWLQAEDKTNLATHRNILLNPNGGNVGIGTTAPGSTFVVQDAQGSTAITGTGMITNRSLAYFGTATTGQIFNIVTDDFRIRNQANTTSNLEVTASNTNVLGTLTVQGTGNTTIAGNVGIGTASPAMALDVLNTTPANSASTLEAGRVILHATPASTDGHTYSGLLGSVDNFGVTANGTYTMAGLQGTATANQAFNLNNVEGVLGNGVGNASGATVTNTYGVYGSGQAQNGTLTNGYGVYGEAKSVGGSFGTGYGGYFTATNGTSATYGVYGTATGTGTTNYGGYFTASGATNNYGLIVAAGSVGIGTTSPTQQVQVLNNQNARTSINIVNGNAGATAIASVDVGAIGGNAMHLQTLGSGFSSSGLNTANYGVLTTDSGLSGLNIFTGSGNLTLGTAATAALTIDSSQRVGIGTTTPGYSLDIGPSGTSSGKGGAVKFRELAANGTFGVGFKAPDNIPGAADIIWTLPSADGSANQVLQTNGSGVLSWTANAATGMANPMTTTGDIIYASNTASPSTPARLGIGSNGQCLVVTSGLPAWGACAGTAAAAGSNTQVQFNNSGSFGADAAFVWNNTSKALTISSSTAGAATPLTLQNTSNGNTSSAALALGNDASASALTLSVNSSTFTSAGSVASLTNTQNAALTFGTNNSERMRISSAGNVGIGTNNPGYPLTVYASGTNQAAYIYGDAVSGVTPYFSFNPSNNGNGGELTVIGAAPNNTLAEFHNGSTNQNSVVEVSSYGYDTGVALQTVYGTGSYVTSYRGTGRPLFLGTHNNMSIVTTADPGVVGINVTSPTSTLAIQPAATSGTPSATAGSGFQLLGTNTYTDNNTATSGTATGYNLATIAQGTLAATNTSVTTTNAYSLNILGAPKGGTNETLTNSIALNIASAALTNTTNGYGLQVAAPTGATNNYAAAFLGGNVGIGTATPITPLHVKANLNGTLLRVEQNGAFKAEEDIVGVNSTLILGVENNSGSSLFTNGLANAAEIGTAGSYPLQLGTNATPNMTILTSGNVGIGLTNPSQLLTINSGGSLAWDNGSGTADVGLSRGSSGWLYLGNGTAGNAGGSFAAATVQAANFSASNTTAKINFWNGSSFDTSISRGGVETVAIGNGTPGDYSGTLAAGNIAIGTATASQALTVGTGNAQSNILDGDGWLCIGNGTTKCTSSYSAGTIYSVAAAVGSADYAENYLSTNLNMQPGMLVTTDASNAGNMIATTGIGYDPALTGVISTNPGVLIGNGDTSNPPAGTKAYPIALTGRVPVLITDENGPVHAGDYLTSSASMPGYAMKATHSGMIVGQALANFDMSSGVLDSGVQTQTINGTTFHTGTITAFVHVQFAQINNTYVIGADDATVAQQTVAQGTTNTGLTSTNNADTFVIRQNPDPKNTSSDLVNILQLQAGSATRFMVASTGQTTINAAVADNAQNLLVINNNGSQEFAITAKGDAIVTATLIVKKDIASLGTVLGSTSVLARNADNSDIAQGDVVMLKGVESNNVVGNNPVLSVALASSASSAGNEPVVIGIADRNLSDFDIPGAPASAASSATDIPAGEYMNVVTGGTFSVVKIDATSSGVAVGDKLTVSANAGYARKYDPTTDGNLPIIGIALDQVAVGSTGQARILLMLDNNNVAAAMSSTTSTSSSSAPATTASAPATSAPATTSTSSAGPTPTSTASSTPDTTTTTTSSTPASSASITPSTTTSTTPATPTTPTASTDTSSSTPTVTQPTTQPSLSVSSSPDQSATSAVASTASPSTTTSSDSTSATSSTTSSPSASTSASS